MIAAADDARRRLQRDVHDGAQQRLVHTIITLKLARDRADAGGSVGELLAEALSNAEEAQRQLRDILRGILPASLTRAGLAAGVRSIIDNTPIPVDVKLDVPRMPAAVETTGILRRRRSGDERGQARERLPDPHRRGDPREPQRARPHRSKTTGSAAPSLIGALG